MSHIATRKIIVGFVLLLVGIVVTYWKNDIPPNLLSLMSTIFISFCSANSIEYLTKMFNGRNGKPSVRKGNK